jgi:CPA2 family monovalent cation:H+ antiporter-2
MQPLLLYNSDNQSTTIVMNDLILLRDLLLLIAIAIPAVAGAQRLKIPAVVAFLITGMAIGPHGLGLIARPDEVAALAEIGVVLLLFEIGLEVSLAQVIRLRSTIALGGTMQIAITVGATWLIGMLLDMPAAQAVAFGCLFALSSTAIVLTSHRDRGELDAPHGRVSLAVLLFQDLMIVPLIVLLQIFGTSGGDGEWREVARPLLGLLILIVVVPVGRVLVPAVLKRVPDIRGSDLFTLVISFFGLGAAFLAASLGLSLAVGAFIAGLIISESEYGAQALSDVLPFRALFSSIFFTSVGMLLDLGFVTDNIALVGSVGSAVIVGKALIVMLVVTLVLRRPLFTGILSGLALAQVGEFSFVLASVALGTGLIADAAYQVFLAASVLSMAATPFLMAGARPIGEWVMRMVGGSPPEDATATIPSSDLTDHAIIVGYGLSGRHLASVMKAAHLKYIVLETNGQVVRAARDEGESIAFGDGTRREVLLKAGIRSARVLVMNIASPLDERRGVAVAKELNPNVKILVRTRTVDAIADLEERGANDVIVEEYEAALELFQRVLRHYHIPMNTISTEMDAVRAEHYGILRGVPKDVLRLDQLRFLGIHHALELVEVEEGSVAVGENPFTLRLRSTTHATVVAVVRKAVPIYTFDADSRFLVGDTVVLVGPLPALVRAIKLFRAKQADS